MRTILFICTGNTCRSPMAEAIAQHWLDGGVLSDGQRYLVASAGTSAVAGAHPTLEAVRAIEARKLGLDGRSKRLTADMIRNAEVVFGMTATHVEAARALVADDAPALAKIHPLDPDADIADPIGMGQEAYDRLVERFMVLIPRRLKEVFSVKIALGSDHRGTDAVRVLLEHLRAHGHDPEVLGDDSGEPTDYPDSAYLVARAVERGDADYGVLVCGSGIGMSIAANKMPGIRAGLAQDARAAEMTRRHNDANVLCLSGDRGEAEEMKRIVDAFLGAAFEGGRHQRRVDKIRRMERGEDPGGADAVHPPAAERA